MESRRLLKRIFGILEIPLLGQGNPPLQLWTGGQVILLLARLLGA